MWFRKTRNFCFYSSVNSCLLCQRKYCWLICFAIFVSLIILFVYMYLRGKVSLVFFFLQFYLWIVINITLKWKISQTNYFKGTTAIFLNSPCNSWKKIVCLTYKIILYKDKLKIPELLSWFFTHCHIINDTDNFAIILFSLNSKFRFLLM